MDSVSPEKLQISSLSVHLVVPDIYGKTSTSWSQFHQHLDKLKSSWSYRGNMSKAISKHRKIISILLIAWAGA